VFDTFELAGQLSPAQFKAGELDGEWSKDVSTPASGRKLEFPLNLTVVNF
jgi:hypothetical protein